MLLDVPATNPYKVPAEKLVAILQRLWDRHPDMSVLQATLLFYVAANPGISQRDLHKALNTTDSAASRTLAVLSDVGTRQVKGLDLVLMRVNPNDRRERLCELSPKGKRLMSEIKAILK